MEISMDRVVLVESSGAKHLVALDREVVSVPGVGVVRAETLRASIGRRWSIGDRALLVLTPSIRDEIGGIRRGPQIVAPKDIPVLVWNCNVKPGEVVVEAGAGSGALTLALAHAVGPSGRVVTYDVRRDFLDLAQENLTAAGLAARVEFRIGDVRTGVAEREADAFVLDIPDPWAAIESAAAALRACGHLATYSPNIEQVSRTVGVLQAGPFAEVRTVEVIEREMEVRETGTHPSFAPLGHSGYLTFARKVLEAVEPGATGGPSARGGAAGRPGPRRP